MPELSVESLTMRFGDFAAVENVSFNVVDGEFFTLLGPSGCGKSTTLSCIAGLIKPDEGRIQAGGVVFFDGKQGFFLPPEKRDIGMVFQSYALWPHMTVAQNLALPLRVRQIGRSERDERIHHTLAQVDLAEKSTSYPHELSGGQQQRVALARALVYQPRLLLLDEPLSNLDARLRDRAREWLKDLQRRIGVTTVYVTHDQLEALSLSDRIAVMGDRRVLQVGTPKQIYEAPASPLVASFIGRFNFLPGRVVESANGRGDVFVSLEGDRDRPIRVAASEKVQCGSEIHVAVRAEKLKLSNNVGRSDGRNLLNVKVLSRSYVGARYEYQLEFGGSVIYAEDPVEYEGDVQVTVPMDGCVTFSANEDLRRSVCPKAVSA